MSALVIFLAISAILIFANWKTQFDRDDKSGGQGPWHRAAYPKMYVHAASAFALTVILMDSMVDPFFAAAAVFIAGLGWEWSQRHWRIFDIVGNGIGIALAVALGTT